MKKVPLFFGREIIGVVEYNKILDRWNGDYFDSKYNAGVDGFHMGIGKLVDGNYYICFGMDNINTRSYAIEVSEYDAEQIVLKHNPNVFKEIFHKEPTKLQVPLYDTNGDYIDDVDFTSNLRILGSYEEIHHLEATYYGVGITKDGTYYVCKSKDNPAYLDHANVISAAQAEDYVLRYNVDAYKKIFGEEPENLTLRE